MDRTLIVCVGNELVADDGVGYRVYQQLKQRSWSSDVRLVLLGVGGMALLDELDGEKLLIVVDAVQFGAAPGTVHVLDWEHIPASELRPVSGHGIGVREALQVCRKLYPEKAAGNIFLVGVEGACFDQVGQGLSPSVASSLAVALAKIDSLVAAGSS